ncbi:segregation and condensation protein A [Caproicibacterium lactatifermentans]|jgi:segregation and condensation protein A|uniref:Segregation and condensation protein A n=1 Tax=Caproicibacterium lactatifermentans TaxID=2666138 RepID=A0A859DUP8_9FIRM|nr:segregation/condensation protein A [Caproicibacterium lactatifermentans]QKN24013.1 serine protease [Caproicibacterium lactatifermentans]
MEKLTYKLDAFEGPLDLLLYLIRKNKLNICDIPIAEVLQQYMDHIHAAQQKDMDVSSEFLDMAARLVYMKTVYLLPKHEEAETMRAQLSGQLLEYEECKKVAAVLGGTLMVDTSFTREPEPVAPDFTYRRPINPENLQKAYYGAAGRRMPPPTQKSFSKLVAHRVVSVASQMVGVMRCLWKKGRAAYQELFRRKQNRSEIVATFLALLELIHDKRVRVEGEGNNPTVKLTKVGEHKWNAKT